MESITLKDIAAAVRVIRRHVSIRSEIVQHWVEELNCLLPESVRDDQTEYTIAQASKEEILNGDNCPKSIALLMLYRQASEEVHHFTTEKKLTIALDTFEDEAKKTALAFYKRWNDYLKQYAHRRTIYSRPNYDPIILDQVLRWLTLALLGPSGQPYEEWVASDWQVYFFIIQIVAIPIVSLAFAYYQNKKNELGNCQLLVKTELTDLVILKKSVNQSYFFFLISIALAGVFITYILLYEGGNSLPISIAVMVAWALYLIVYHSWNTGKLSEKMIAIQTKDAVDFSVILSPDQNDEVIVDIAAQLKSATGRLEAYVLESALFGALAFSGFLQIMAEKLVSFSDLEIFSNHMYMILMGIVFFDWSLMDFAFLSSTTSIFSLIAVETLICSILFLGVIASRLRFSNIADQINLHADIANSYNHKEEMLMHADKKDKDDRRLAVVNLKIHNHLSSADQILEQLLPITNFMKFFRNGGILTFLVVLITSALLISKFLALIFIALSIGTVVYFNANKLYELMHVVRFKTQYVVIHHRKTVLLVSILMVLSGTFLSMYYQISWFQWVLGIGFLLLWVYRLSMIFIVSEVDENFILKAPISFKVKLFWGIGESFVFFGVFFGQLIFFDLVGAKELTTIGLATLAFVLVVLFWQFSKKWWFGLLMSLSGFFCLSGGLFKLLFLPGGDETLILAGVLIVITLTLFLLNKNLLHQQMKWFALVVVCFTVYISQVFPYHQTVLHLQTTKVKDVILISKQFSLDIPEIDIKNFIDVGKILNTGFSTPAARAVKERYARRLFYFLVYWNGDLFSQHPVSETEMDNNEYDQIVELIKSLDPNSLENLSYKNIKELPPYNKKYQGEIQSEEKKED